MTWIMVGVIRGKQRNKLFGERLFKLLQLLIIMNDRNLEYERVVIVKQKLSFTEVKSYA